MSKLDDILERRLGNRMGQIEWEYWSEIAQDFLKRYDLELGANGAYDGHLAILLREVYVKGQEEAAPTPSPQQPKPLEEK